MNPLDPQARRRQVRILLEKRLRVLLPEPPPGAGGRSRVAAATVFKNFEALGYRPGRALFVRLASLSEAEVAAFHDEVIPVLREMRGAHRDYKPFYPDFPRQVIEASAAELYLNALMHYWSFVLKDLGVVGETWLPKYEKQARPPLQEETRYDVIDLGTEDEFRGILTALLAAKTSISEADKAVVTWFVETLRDDVFDLVPAAIPMKEQLALLVGLVLRHTNSAHRLSKLVRTPTDVLRIATALCGGDVSLAENTRFRNLPRKTRRFLLGLLEGCAAAPDGAVREEFAKHPGRWIRLGEALHPGERADLYPKACAAFAALRNGRRIETFQSKVEGSLAARRIPDVVELLRRRPGDFARRLDHVFRSGGEGAAEEFLAVADGVSTPVLLQVANHFRHRNAQPLRPVFPKGALAKMHVLPAGPAPLGETFCRRFAEQVRGVLVARFAKLPPLGTVYLDERLADFPVPFAQRSAAKALRTVSRGSKLPLDGDYDTIRFFVWWKNGRSRTDLDLSAAVLDAEWAGKFDIAYYNLRDIGGHHSGDITDAPNGAAEFIDVSLSKVIQAGGRYIAMCVNSYTTQPLCDLPECFAGWMGRASPNSGGGLRGPHRQQPHRPGGRHHLRPAAGDRLRRAAGGLVRHRPAFAAELSQQRRGQQAEHRAGVQGAGGDAPARPARPVLDARRRPRGEARRPPRGRRARVLGGPRRHAVRHRRDRVGIPVTAGRAGRLLPVGADGR